MVQQLTVSKFIPTHPLQEEGAFPRDIDRRSREFTRCLSRPAARRVAQSSPENVPDPIPLLLGQLMTACRQSSDVLVEE
jgi:hypothetical protein